MKKLSDYKGDEAIELWADLIDPLANIFADKEFTSGLKGKAPIVIAKEVLKKYKKEAVEIMLCIDSTPIDGMNIVLRLVTLLSDIGKNKEIMAFFGSAEQEKEESESSGSAMGNTEDGLK